MSKTKIDKIKKQQTKNTNPDIIKLRKQIDSEIDYTLDGSIKQLFLNLTKMQIPFDYEKTLEEYFPKGMKKDIHGNYYIKIGDTKTMFCAHLDTYCYEYKRVWHVIENNIIKTDGTTTLGGDDKAGIVILIKMIEANIPGLYYFFRGEEGVTSPSGTWGSKQAFKSYKSNFEKYEKCIAFDRKGNDSIITQQMYSMCCSDDFSEALIKQLKNNGLTYEKDPTGMWCDSGVFMDTIPECTNISVGYINEHTFSEQQNIEHLEKLVNACLNIKWDELPVKRDPHDVSYSIGNYHYDYDYEWEQRYKIRRKGRNTDYQTTYELFDIVCDILSDIGYHASNADFFTEDEEMYFQNFKTGDFFGLKIKNFEIYISEDDTLKSYEYIGDLETFQSYVSLGNEDDELKQMNRHLDNISKDINTKYDSDFTDKQDVAFTKFLKEKPEMINKIINDIQNSKKLSLSNNLWLETENEMLDIGLNVDYDINGINPDDLVEWISHNWEMVSDFVHIKSKNNKQEPNNELLKYQKSLGISEDKHKVYCNLITKWEPNKIKNLLSTLIEDQDIYPHHYDMAEEILENKNLPNDKFYISKWNLMQWLKFYQSDLIKYFNLKKGD